MQKANYSKDMNYIIAAKCCKICCYKIAKFYEAETALKNFIVVTTIHVLCMETVITSLNGKKVII